MARKKKAAGGTCDLSQSCVLACMSLGLAASSCLYFTEVSSASVREALMGAGEANILDKNGKKVSSATVRGVVTDINKARVWAPPKPEALDLAQSQLQFDSSLTEQERQLGMEIVRYSSQLVPIQRVGKPARYLREAIGLKVVLEAKPLACENIFLNKPNVPPPGTMPPKFDELTDELKQWYTHGGAIPVFDFYVHNDYHNSASKNRFGFTTSQFQKANIDKLQVQCEPLSRCQFERDTDPKRDPFKCPFGHPTSGGHNVCRTAERFKLEIRGKRGFVIGSQWPWVEAIMFAAGAREMVTFEYANASTDRPNYSVLHPNEVKRRYLTGHFNKEDQLFDFGITFSSLEHDGMGRYADPMNPSGDLEAIAQAACVLKPGAPMFLGVPTLDDFLVWNDQRVYGHRRLALMFAPFEILEVVGEQPFVDKQLPVTQTQATQAGGPCRPRWACNHHVIFALRKPR